VTGIAARVLVAAVLIKGAPTCRSSASSLSDASTNSLKAVGIDSGVLRRFRLVVE